MPSYIGRTHQATLRELTKAREELLKGKAHVQPVSGGEVCIYDIPESHIHIPLLCIQIYVYSHVLTINMALFDNRRAISNTAIAFICVCMSIDTITDSPNQDREGTTTSARKDSKEPTEALDFIRCSEQSVYP